jgi:hypothetical protein
MTGLLQIEVEDDLNEAVDPGAQPWVLAAGPLAKEGKAVVSTSASTRRNI